MKAVGSNNWDQPSLLLCKNDMDKIEIKEEEV